MPRQTSDPEFEATPCKTAAIPPMTTYLTSWEAKDANTLRRRLSRRGLGELGPVLERQLGELDE
jgi:hypothetical protein